MKKTISKVSSMLLICVLAVSMLVVTASADTGWGTLTGQRIELTAPEGEVNVGDKISIPITISNPNSIKGVFITITWDPTLLKADPTFKLGKYNCFTYPTQNDDGVSIQDQTKSLNVNEVASGKIVYGAAAGYAFDDYTTPLSAGVLKLEVLEAAAGKNVTVSVYPNGYYDEATGTFGGTYGSVEAGNINFDAPKNASFKVAGGSKTAADIGLKTDASQIFTNKEVTNANNETYTVNSAIAFVSCVDKAANATDVYTKITRENSSKELKIPATLQEVGEQYYFAAAVTSIRENNYGKKFYAQAFATVDGQEVTDSNVVEATYSPAN